MSIFAATLLSALFLIIFGGLFLWNGAAFQKNMRAFPRSEKAAYISFGGASLWFLWIISGLGEADFGEHKVLLFLFFLALSCLSFVHVKDFLSVRGLAGLILLVSYPLLGAAYFQEPQSRLFLVSFVYVAIVCALFLGAMPFLFRNALEWLFASPKRSRILGATSAAYGLLLFTLAFSYSS